MGAYTYEDADFDRIAILHLRRRRQNHSLTRGEAGDYKAMLFMGRGKCTLTAKPGINPVPLVMSAR
ncbi:MAG TPA: hypothetical protein VF779_05645 [Pyrinomonadaceae bacterium]